MPTNATKNDKEIKKPAEQETISELVERHMKDENHTTTDEELRNAKIEYSSGTDQDLEDFVEAENKTVLPPIYGEPEPSPDKDDEEGSVPNPYDVLK